jgi:hypothetical protein
MKNIFLLSLTFLFLQTLNGQVSLSAGTGFLRGFQSEKTFFGVHGGFELPRNNDVTIYGRVGQYFSQAETQTITENGEEIEQVIQNTALVTGNDFNVIPYQLQVNYARTFNYTTLEGGTRYYIGNDYDNGFSGYGGSNFLLAFNSVKRDYEKTDITGEYEWENNYNTSGGEEDGRIISFALGVQGGVKYTIPGTGTVYFDISAQYNIAGVPNNATAQETNLYSPLFFIFNVGFRKDLY